VTHALDGWTPVEYGRSRDGVALRVFTPARGGPVAGLLTAGVHGEESMTTLVARRVLEQIAGTETGWAVVPVVNPDGVLAGTRQNAAGVDINRNFPASTWGLETSFTYPPGIGPSQRVPANRTNPSSPGGEPGSEPETRALLDLVERLAPPLVVDLHTPLELMLVRRGVPTDVVEQLSTSAGLDVVEELPGCPGAFDDWLEEREIPAIVYEFEQGSFPAVCARHLPGLVGLLRGTPLSASRAADGPAEGTRRG
jgi:protein MpaA